jgi:hypothetical protein
MSRFCIGFNFHYYTWDNKAVVDRDNYPSAGTPYGNYKMSTLFSAMMQSKHFKSTLRVLVFEIHSTNIEVSKTLKFEQEGETVVLDIRGLI